MLRRENTMEDNKWDAFLFVEKQKLKERDSVKDQTKPCLRNRILPWQGEALRFEAEATVKVANTMLELSLLKLGTVS